MDLNFHNMAQKNKSQLVAEIDAIYVDCGTECITPEAVNAFEKDKTDSYAILNEDNDFSGVGTWTKQIREHKGANITVGSTLTLTNDGNYFHVTGASTSITSITTRQHGTRVSFYFVNSQTLTHSTSLRLPNAIDYDVRAGEIIEFVSEGSGNWRFKSTSLSQSIKSFDVTITDTSAIQGCGSTPIELVVASSGKKIQALTAFVEISGGSADYDFIDMAAITDSLATPCMGTVQFDYSAVTIIPMPVLNSVSTNAFCPLPDFRFIGDGLYLSQSPNDATTGDRQVRVWGTYIEMPA